VTKFDEYLNGPARDLINYRINFDGSGDEGRPPSEMTYEAVYGWQDADAEGNPGQWHIVKAEVRLPRRCQDNCGPGQTSPDPEWPRVRSKTSKGLFGGSTCYELINTEGSVKARVTRWDQPQNNEPITFPTGEEVWTFDNTRPGSTNTGGGIGAVCQPIEPASLMSGAFIMNDPSDDGDCWALAHTLLRDGYSFESCADYYYEEGGGGRGGNTLKFDIRPCRPF
jgi:hypothetical protein